MHLESGYGLDLSMDERSMWRWVRLASRVAWKDPRTLGSLVTALDEILDPQARA